MKALLNWLDDRTGYKALLYEALYERIPGGSRWRYVWGSTLVFAFSVQLVTGFFLWMAYSPSAQTAWESVYYIQYEMQCGWLLRGLHHFTAQLMVVLMALHLLQVIIDGAYKAPREVNFWLGLILMQIVLGLSLTGYLLPWDQKGYWATQVATSLASILPVVGPMAQKLVVGGPTYGHHTLTRFFAMHAGVLPALLVAFLGLHIYVFRRHGITVKDPQHAPEATFWPDQVLKDSVACLGVLFVVLLLVFRHLPAHANELATIAAEGRLGDVFGAHLDSPADPSDSYSAARPEWYFLFLFQFLKYFPGESEIFGAVVIPGLALTVMVFMPLLGRWKLGHRFNIAYTIGLALGAGFLTWVALQEDRNDAGFQRAVADAELKADRVIQLIRGPGGIGKSGAVELLRSDPKTNGPELFAKNCSQCHRFNEHNGTGEKPESPATASDLGEFGRREWIREFIKHPSGPNHFGPTARGAFNGKPIDTRFTEGEMAEWAAGNVAKMKPSELEGVVEFLVAQGGRTDLELADAALAEIGRDFFVNGTDAASACGDCHALRVGDEELSSGAGEGYPDLTQYGSEEWLVDFVRNPGSERHYGSEKNAMPMFESRMSAADLRMLVRWLRQSWYEPTAKASPH